MITSRQIFSYIFNNAIIIAFFILITESRASILHIPSEFPLISAAIGQSERGDTILIAEGDYEQPVFINTHGLTLAGEYLFTSDTLSIAATKIFGSFNNRPLTIILAEDDTVSVIGITFLNGSGVGEGGGVYIEGATININHNVIRDNSADATGGAQFYNCYGVINCNIVKNNQGLVWGTGGLCTDGGNYFISGNLFQDNSSVGVAGGLNFYNAGGVLENNIFNDNNAQLVGGGAKVSGNGRRDISDNIFINNTSYKGGGLYLSTIADSIIIRNNLFYGNRAEVDEVSQGGGIGIGQDFSNKLIYNNMFRYNSANHDGGAIHTVQSLTLFMNIFNGNQSQRVSAVAVQTGNGSEPVVEAYQNIFQKNFQMVLPDPDQFYVGAVTSFQNTHLELYENDFIENQSPAAGYCDHAWNEGDLVVENNYWGDPSGPCHEDQNPDGLGDTVDVRLDILPFSEELFTNFQPPDSFELIEPLDGATNWQLPVLFTWQSTTDPNPEDEIEYTLELSTDVNFEEIFYYFCGIDTFREVWVSNFESTYWWRVWAHDDRWGERKTEPREIFITSNDLIPRPFNLGQPENESIVDQTPVLFSWYPSIDYSYRDELTYTLEFENVDNFNDPIHLSAGSDTFLIIDDIDWENNYRWHVFVEDLAGHRTYSNEIRDFHLTSIPEHDSSSIPSTWELKEPYPNPFNPVVSIVAGVPFASEISAEIYDLLGRKVEVLYSGKINPGYHRLQWWADNASGIYLLQVRSNSGWHSTKKLLLVK